MLRTNKPCWIVSWFLPLVASIVIATSPAVAADLDLPTDSFRPTTPSISQGDFVVVHGTATGHPSVGLQVWVIGTNYVRVMTVSVNDDNTYVYEITKSETQNMASGQYFVLIQHPMMNGEFDITYNPGTGDVVNRQLGGGTVIFRLTGAGSLQGPAGASALLRAVADQNIDDTFTTVSFFIEPPTTLINPVPDHAVGDKFTITGTTNLAVGDNLMVEIYSSSFKPTSKGQTGEFSGANGLVQVQKGAGGLNSWSFDVDAATFKPDEYIITVSAIQQNVKGSATFTIAEKKVIVTTTLMTVRMTTTPPPVTITTVAVPETTQKTPVETGIALAGSLIALIIWYNRDKL